MGNRKLRAHLTSLAALCTMALLGCAGPTGLQKGFHGGGAARGESAHALLDTFEQRRAGPSVAGAVGVTGRGLVGRALPDGERWEYVGAVETLPIIDGGAVAVSGADQVTLLDLRTGKPRWPNSLPASGRRLAAMTHDGRNTLLVLADPDDSRAQLLVVVRPDGREVGRATSEPAVGRPAAREGLALVPWDGRFVTLVDLTRGISPGRFQLETPTTAVAALPGGTLLFGQGVLRLADEVLADPPPAPLQLPPKNLPGAPRWPEDGTITLQPQRSPVAIFAQPTITDGALGFAGETFASTYHRVVLAFGASQGQLRWVTHFLRDIVGGDAGPHGPTLCLEDGSLWRLSWKDGSRASSGTLQSRLRACVVSFDPRPVDGARPLPLAQQVATTLTDTGPDMAPVHQLLLDELSSSPSPEVTRLLVDIARSPRASADLAEQAARRIALRRTGAEHLIAALEDSVDFDVNKRPAPLASIASALFAMDARDGAGPLARHLVDPRTSVVDQLMLARVLRVLAGPGQAPELAEYFGLYRTAASEPELAQAVILTGQTLWEVGGESGRAIVVEAARDPMTHPNVRPGLERLIAGEGAPSTPESGAPNAPSSAAPGRAPVRRPPA